MYLQNLSAIYKFTKYRMIMKKRVHSLNQFIQWFLVAVFSHVFLFVYKFTSSNYSFRVAYHVIFVFVMRIWVNDKATQKWGSEDVCLDESLSD